MLIGTRTVKCEQIKSLFIISNFWTHKHSFLIILWIWVVSVLVVDCSVDFSWRIPGSSWHRLGWSWIECKQVMAQRCNVFTCFFFLLMEKDDKMPQKIISTSQEHANRPFAGWNTQHWAVCVCVCVCACVCVWEREGEREREMLKFVVCVADKNN